MHHHHRLFTAALAALFTALFTFACDAVEDKQDDPLPRFWPPEEIQIKAEVATPLVVGPLLECFVSDEQRAIIEYEDGLIGDDDKKDIHVCVQTRGHEDRALCWREALEKLGGEVMP